MRNNRFEMVLVLDIRDDVERIGGREPSQATPIVSGTKVIKTGFGIAFFAREIVPGVCGASKTCREPGGRFAALELGISRRTCLGFLGWGATLAAIKGTAAEGPSMTSRKVGTLCFPVVLESVATLPPHARSFRVRCPTSTITCPSTLHNNISEPVYIGQTTLALNTQEYTPPTANLNGAIKRQQASGGDGYATTPDGMQTFMLFFEPLSGLSPGIRRGFRGGRLN